MQPLGRDDHMNQVYDQFKCRIGSLNTCRLTSSACLEPAVEVQSPASGPDGAVLLHVCNLDKRTLLELRSRAAHGIRSAHERRRRYPMQGSPSGIARHCPIVCFWRCPHFARLKLRHNALRNVLRWRGRRTPYRPVARVPSYGAQASTDSHVGQPLRSSLA